MQSTAYGKGLSRNQRERPYLTSKAWLVMKLTVFLLLAAILQVSARTYSQSITLSVKNLPLEKVFTEIEKQSGFTFIYGKKEVAKASPVTIDLVNAPLERALQSILKNQPLNFSISEKFIMVAPQPMQPLAEGLDPRLSAPPSPIDISGKITDKDGNPLNGASVKVKGTNKGTTTALDGVFVLKGVDGNAVLEISFIGYESTTISVNNKTAIIASLNVATQSLQEVVVSKGYYEVKQRFNTGNTSTISAKEIGEQPLTDPMQAVIGKVAGLNIQQTSGMPGAYSTIRIRGVNSIANGNDPLYIVDGVPFTSATLTNPNIGGGALGIPNNSNNNVSNINGVGMSPFNSLNPADIESIEVLKDADATAIYGSRGANGVILITTKNGKAGASKFDLNLYSGFSSAARKIDMYNTQQYLAMRREALKNDGLPVPNININPSDNNYDINGVWDTTRYTNWQKALIGNTDNFTNVQGSFSGGSANTQFLIAGGYSKQGTVFAGNYSDQKASMHVNVTHASTDQKFHIQLTASYVTDNNVLPQVDFTSNITLAPDAPAIYDQFGNLNWQVRNGVNTWNNPLASTFRQAKAITDNVIGDLNLSYEIMPGLQLKGTFGYNHMQMNQSNLIFSTSIAPPNNLNPNFRQNNIATTDLKTWNIEPQLSYQKQIGLGKLEALFGATFQQRDLSSIAQSFRGFSSDALVYNPASAATPSFSGDNYTLYKYAALYARVGYNLEEKYLLNLTVRRDGSSRFGSGKQFGNFGAVGLGWIFSKEKFVQNILPLLSFGKLRSSYGTTGNDQIPDYQFLSTYSSSSSTYQGIAGLYPTQLTNQYFAWEVVKKLEGGLELGFLKDRISVSLSYYRNRTGNQLVGYALPAVSGFTSVQYNLPAIVQNSGFELGLNTTNIKTKNFNWTTSINFTLPKNKLVAFPGIENFGSYKNNLVVGQSLFIKKVYHYIGVNPQTGIYSFATNNTSGSPGTADQIISQALTQKYFGGMQNSFSYKGFQLDVLLQYVNQINYNFQEYIATANGINSNQPIWVDARWQKPGDQTNIQRFGTNATVALPGNSLLRNSDGVFTDASFLRFRNLAFSYLLPAKWISKAHLQNARVYLQCQNLFTITKYKGLDPESGGSGTFLSLPPLRTITAGVKFTL